jgi:hypothetical protein
LFLQSPQCHPTSGHGRVRAPWKTEQLSTGGLCTGKAMETHLYTTIFFFSFTRFFLWTYRKITYYFFLCPVSISRTMNAKKKSHFDREDKSDGNPLVHHRFFFFFHKNFPMNIQNDYLLFFRMQGWKNTIWKNTIVFLKILFETQTKKYY